MMRPSIQRRWVLWLLLLSGAAVALVVVASVLPGPDADVPQVRSGAPLFDSAQLMPEATQMLRRACANCHSNETEWPGTARWPRFRGWSARMCETRGSL